MAKPENVIRLLIVEDSEEDAEHLVSVLRNGGIAVRPSRVTDPKLLAEQLESHPYDLLLVNAKSKAHPLFDIANIAQRSGKDLPVVALIRASSDDAIISAYRDGATAIAIHGLTEHVQRVVRREFENL